MRGKAGRGPDRRVVEAIDVRHPLRLAVLVGVRLPVAVGDVQPRTPTEIRDRHPDLGVAPLRGVRGLEDQMERRISVGLLRAPVRAVGTCGNQSRIEVVRVERKVADPEYTDCVGVLSRSVNVLPPSRER